MLTPQWKLLAVLSIASVPLLALISWAQPPATAAGEQLSTQTAPTEVPAYKAVRAELFAHIQKQTQVESTLPSFPAPSNKTEEVEDSSEPDELSLWVEQRAEEASKGDDKARYSTLSEHLLIAQELLRKPDLEIRKQGFTIANDSANFAAAHLKQDKWLLARIYEGFLLPQISLAHIENSESPARQTVLEKSVSVFGSAGERPKQIAVLDWLLSIGDKPEAEIKGNPDTLTLDTNTLDWARGTLAALLFESPEVTQSERVRALSLLKSIQSPDMEGFKHLQRRVEASLAK